MNSIANLDFEASPRQKVVGFISRAIDSGHLSLGSPLPAERRLAERLNVSREAVRAALADLSKLEIIGQRGHGRMRQVLRTPLRPMTAFAPQIMSNTVVLLGTAKLVDPTHFTGADVSINYEISRRLELAGHHVMAVNPSALTAEGPSSVAALKVAGVLVTYSGGESQIGRSIMHACRDSGIPVVAFGNASELAPYDRVESDHRQGACELMRLLAQRGRRRVLRVWRLAGEHHWLSQRDVGYEQAAGELGLTPLPPVRIPAIAPDGASEREKHQYVVRVMAGYLGEHVLSPGRVDAIMCDTDGHALHAIAALELLGKRPNIDIDVVGYDNYWSEAPEAQWVKTAPLATIDKDATTVAEAMTSLLEARRSSGVSGKPQLHLIAPTLVIPQAGAAVVESSLGSHVSESSDI